LTLPVAIHCRESFDEVIAIVEEENTRPSRGVFHCFQRYGRTARACAGPRRFLSLASAAWSPTPRAGFATSHGRRWVLTLCAGDRIRPYLAPCPIVASATRAATSTVAAALATATGR
jgi:TatD DNase family protein